MKQKVVIAAVPFIDTHRAMAAPAVLKAALVAQGIDTVALDLNADVVTKIHYRADKKLFLDFFYKKKIHLEITDELARIIDHCVDRILKHDPTIIAISLFAGDCQNFTSWLCAAIRQKNNQAKIVIGGPGLMTLYNGTFNFCDHLKRRGLIDDFISGDGEISIVEYVKGNKSYPGINSTDWKPVPDLNKLDMPDYSDYNFYFYNEPTIPIIDSRGCVQDCEFCDVIAFWDKFQYLNADSIFDQMLKQQQRYNISRFDLRSSICNGNLREFRKLVRMIAEYNRDKFYAEQIRWEGSFIIRPASQHNERLWQDLKDSNAFLFMGVESLTDRVRHGLGKRFNNEDLEYHLEMAKKYQVPVNLLLIAAYPTETVDDYETAKQWFRDHTNYANNTVNLIQLSSPSILPGSHLEANVDADEFNRLDEVRMSHKADLAKVITDSGFNVMIF